MMGLLKNLFGRTSQPNFVELVAKGAQIIDVRSPQEFKSGHIAGAINIPLDTLSSNVKKISKNNPVITCCASGMRSASAKALLRAHGFTDVYNGGGWSSLQAKLN